MSSNELYDQDSRHASSEWDTLMKKEGSPESQEDIIASYKEKLATAMWPEVPDGVEDKDAYQRTPEYFSSMYQSLFGAMQETPPGMTEDEAQEIAVGTLIDEARIYVENGGIMSDDIDELVFPREEYRPEEIALLASHEDAINSLRKARLEQCAGEEMKKYQHIAERLKESRKSSSETDSGYFRISADLEHFALLRKYDAAENGTLDPVVDFIRKEIVPEYFPNPERLMRGGPCLETLKKFSKVAPELLNDAPDNIQSCLRFLYNSENEMDSRSFRYMERTIADALYNRGGEAKLFDENGEPTEELRVAIMLDPTTAGLMLNKDDDPNIQEITENRKKICEKYLNKEQLQVFQDLAELDLDRPPDDAIIASLYLEKDPNIYAAKLKAIKKITNSYNPGTAAIELLAQINTPEDADLTIEELQERASKKLFTIGLYRKNFTDNKPYDRMYKFKAYEELMRRFDSDKTKTEFGLSHYAERENFRKYLLAPLDDRKAFRESDYDNFLAQIGSIEQLYNDEDLTPERRLEILAAIAQKNIPTDENYPQNIANVHINAKNFLAIYGNKYDPFQQDSVFGSFLELNSIYDHEISEQSLGNIKQLIDQISYSNSGSLQRLMTPIITGLLHGNSFTVGEDNKLSFDYDNAKEKLEKIEQIFLRNNLPPIAKNFLVFKTIHPMDQFEQDFVQGNEHKLSPMLTQAETKGPFGSYGIILRGLIRNSLESNDITMRKYLENMRDGQNILDRIKSGETSYDDLNEAEQREATTFIHHIAAMYNQTGAERSNQIDAEAKPTQESIQQLEQILNIKENDSIANRAVRYFGFTAGLRTVEDALRKMDRGRDEADRRNRETAKHPLVIHEGDLIKNVNGAYLDNILTYGSNAKEFLGEDADTDQTALDTDVTMRLGEDVTIEDCTEIQDNPNGNYGYAWFVLENTSDNFMTTRQGDGHPGEVEDANPADNRPELFQTGVLGESHYGIGIGFGSEKIKAIVIQQSDGEAGEYLDRTCFRIVKNGFYIPVYDKQTGQLIFTEEQYDKMRAQLSGNPEYETGPYQQASAEDFNNDVERIAQLGLGQEIDTAANIAETGRKDAAIRNAIAAKLLENDPGLRDYIDGDVTPGVIEVSSTGSTGRGTNIPGDGDFDYIFRIDRDIYMDYQKMSELTQRIRSAIHFTENVSESRQSGMSPYDIRTKHVHVDGLADEVDIDITFIQRTDKITYATENAVRDYLDNLEGDQRDQAIKNIIAAKKLFKQHECYKPKHAGGKDKETEEALAQGGMGGIGTENWILQNGGSLTAAARSFLQATGVLDENGQRIPGAEPVGLSQFTERYQIWDLGANHTSERKGEYPHDNFIANNLDEIGYQKITKALIEYLGV